MGVEEKFLLKPKLPRNFLPEVVKVLVIFFFFNEFTLCLTNGKLLRALSHQKQKCLVLWDNKAPRVFPTSLAARSNIII